MNFLPRSLAVSSIIACLSMPAFACEVRQLDAVSGNRALFGNGGL
jgi:hypothetical protein